MAVNNAFESDSSEVRRTQAAPGKNETDDRQAPNEHTSINAEIDTYFSEEKVHIPEQVSSTFDLSIYNSNERRIFDIFSFPFDQ